jgi:hypothetical protein
MELVLIAVAVGCVLLAIAFVAGLWYSVSLIFSESESGQQRETPWFVKILACFVMLFTLLGNRNQQPRYPELAE